MKLVLPFIFFFSVLGSSFALEKQVEYEEVVAPQSGFYMPYNDVTLGTIFTVDSGPSDAELALTAKLDSQEVQMNLLFDAMDSMNRVQIMQVSSIRKLERKNKLNKDQLKKDKQKSKEASQKSTWIILFLGIATVLIALFALRLFMIKRTRQQAQGN